MGPEELQRLIQQGETQEVEFKSSVPAPQDIAKNLTALANTSGGVLILGVKEPGQIVGVDEHRARAMIEKAQEYMKPVPAINVQSLHVHGHPVVVAQVPSSKELHSAMGGYFGRGARPSEQVRDSAGEMHREDANRPLTANEILLHVRKGKTDDAALSRLSKAVAEQTHTIERHTETIDKLSRDLAKADAPWKKIVLALVGVLAGAILKHFIDQWLN